MAVPQSIPSDNSTKRCPVCGQTYPRTCEFWRRNKEARDGLQSICKQCRRQYARQVYQRDPLTVNAANREKKRALRLAILTYYSGGSPQCACCGETHVQFLAIDHINGRGRKERGKLQRYGDSLYRWLKMQGYPDGYRVLCHNCNGSLGYYGFCPHDHEQLLERG